MAINGFRADGEVYRYNASALEGDVAIPDGSVTLDSLASGVIDDTLAVDGAAADAKATGDAISALNDGYAQLKAGAVRLEWMSLTYYSATQLRGKMPTITVPDGYTNYRRIPIPVMVYNEVSTKLTGVLLHSGNTIIAYGSNLTSSDEMGYLLLTVFS